MESVEVSDIRPTVVCAVPLTDAARERLAALLGDVRVVDIRDVVDHADAVLAPSGSPQLIGVLSKSYPDAKVIVVELEDDEYDIELGGPVTRLRQAGATAYLAADSIADLARQLRPATDAMRSDDTELPAAAAASLEQAPIESTLADVLQQHLEERQAQRR